MSEYEKVMDKVMNIKKQGVKVVIKKSACRKNKDIVSQYKNGLHFSKWKHITFIGDMKIVVEAMNDLAMDCIMFDTGRGCDYMDWEIDWSLRKSNNIIQNIEIKNNVANEKYLNKE